jgi:hypothetical protein
VKNIIEAKCNGAKIDYHHCKTPPKFGVSNILLKLWICSNRQGGEITCQKRREHNPKNCRYHDYSSQFLILLMMAVVASC